MEVVVAVTDKSTVTIKDQRTRRFSDKFEMRRKAMVLWLRNRKPITIAAYVIALSFLAIVVYDPSYIDYIIPFHSWNEGDGENQGTRKEDADALMRCLIKDAESTTKRPSVMGKLFDLPFVPRDFDCDEMHLKAGKNFTYPEGYMDHADAYKSVLQLNQLVDEASSNEQSWILQDIAQLPFVRTVCETGFNAGHNAFHILTANYDAVLYSFEDLHRFNYTLEMTDFMIIEFPDRFYIYDGSPIKSLSTFIVSQAAQTTCDLAIVDSSQPREVVRNYLRLFRSAASRPENIVIMNAHPDNVVRSPHGAEAEWDAMKQAGELVEHFRCRNAVRDTTANQMGLLVGSFVL